MKNFNLVDNSLCSNENAVFFVDELNNAHSFGYTYSKDKILYNLSLFGNLFRYEKYEKSLSDCHKGLTILFPITRYIVILKIKKDKSKMEMMFLDFRADYSTVDKGLKDIFSDKLITEFKRIKYYREEEYDSSKDNIVLSEGKIKIL